MSVRESGKETPALVRPDRNEHGAVDRVQILNDFNLYLF